MIEQDKFDESWYLRRYPDVANAVVLGQFESGYHHFHKCGRKEGRAFRERPNQTADYMSIENKLFRAELYGFLASDNFKAMKENQDIAGYLEDVFQGGGSK
ncbi:MAG: hypothetical protein KBC73_17780 [Burkholderiaceae bacterium]|nr:hypothetical protein [Burkholderiaceae bacterium]